MPSTISQHQLSIGNPDTVQKVAGHKVQRVVAMKEELLRNLGREVPRKDSRPLQSAVGSSYTHQMQSEARQMD
jgi:hypothetical protein